MSETPRGETPKSPEQPGLAVAQAIAAEREKYIAEQGDLTEREKTLIANAMKKAELAAIEAIQEMDQVRGAGNVWNDIHWVRSRLQNL